MRSGKFQLIWRFLEANHNALDHTVAGVVKDGWNGFNVIHESASRVAALDLGFQPSVAARSSKAPAKFVYLLGADDWEDAEVPADAFVVYQVRS